MTRLVAIATLAAVIGAAFPLHAAVNQRDLKEVTAAPPVQATLPLNLPLLGEDDISKPLRFWLAKKPSVWVLADYTCKTLCGPVISIVSDALARSGLRPGEDFRLIVAGLDPKDTAADAASMKLAQVGRDSENSAASYFLRGDSEAIPGLGPPHVRHRAVAARKPFSFMSFMVAVPSAIKVFNWTATLHKGSIRFDAPMLYALAFIGLFTIGGLTGLFLACLAFDVHATDTYFVVAHGSDRKRSLRAHPSTER